MHSCTTLVAITQWPGSATTTNVGPSSTLPVPRMAPELTAARCFPCAPPLQAAATYNLDEVMAQIRASGHPPGLVARCVRDVDEVGASTVFERSSVRGPSSLHLWFFSVPSEDLHHSTLRGGVRQFVVLGSTPPGRPGSACSCTRGNELLGRRLVEVGEAYALHGVEVIEVAPVFLEAVRRR